MKRWVEKARRSTITRWVVLPLYVIACFYAAQYGGAIVIITVARALGFLPALTSTGGSLIAEGIVYAIMLALLVLPLRYYRKNLVSRDVLGLRRIVGWMDIGLGLAGYVVYFLILVGVTAALVKLVPAYNASQTQDLGFTTLFGMERIVAFVVFVIIAPVAEEVMMRGFLFGNLRKAHMPLLPAMLIVSILFGIAHGQWNVGIDTFILSMIACYLREKTGTIWPGIIIHITKNCVAYMFLFVFMPVR